jgi:hypothetical protein
MSETNKTGISLTLAIIFMVAAVLFILAAIIVFEYGSTTTADGDTITPWYFWLLLAFAFLCFFVIIVIYVFIPSSSMKKMTSEGTEEKVQQNMMEQPAYNITTNPKSSSESSFDFSGTLDSIKKKIFSEPSMNDISSLRR